VSLQGLKSWSWPVFGFALTGFHLVFVLSFLMRGGSTWLISKIRMEPELDKE
jgi:hypothetical protein